jgi:hypothetical protein
LSTTAASPRHATLPWLFSPAVDLFTFLGSAVVSLGLLLIGAPLGLLEQSSPEWTWVFAVLLLDVAHVYATGFRVYLDREERRRRPWLYGLTPLLALLVGGAIYSESPVWFWRLLAYLAVFHFVRQQYGWVALYRSRGGERDRWGYWIDTMAIYLATIYPLAYWHAHLPRNFWWFLEGDFASLPGSVAGMLVPLYWFSLAAYAIRSAYRGLVLGQWNPGKDIVVATTAICWHIGIITFNSDYAFTVTNVIIHGIPYLVLIYWYRVAEQGDKVVGRIPRVASFLGTIWLLAFVEEMLWDWGLWHERAWLFGSSWRSDSADIWLVPLLAVPQITHYVLDGFIWKRRTASRLF